MGGFGASHIVATQSQTFFDFSGQSILERPRMLLQPFAVSVGSVPRAQNTECDLSFGKIRLGLLHDAAEPFEHLPLFIDDGAYPPVERHATQIFEPCYAHACKAPLQRTR